MREHHDVVVIGGGQAGLAMSNVLLQQGREHVVLERRRIGERWRTERWDSLRFQFPNWTLQLPGYEYAGNDPDGFAHYSDILRLIEHYAVRTGAPVRENSEVLAVAVSVSRYRRARRRLGGKDIYWWLEAPGRFSQTIDSFPSRQYPPSTVVTGVNGGYDVNVRQLASDGVTVIGRVVGASGGNLAVQANANQVLDEADKAYTDFLLAARQFISNGTKDDLAEEEQAESTQFPKVEEVDSLDLTREDIHSGGQGEPGSRFGCSAHVSFPSERGGGAAGIERL